MTLAKEINSVVRYFRLFQKVETSQRYYKVMCDCGECSHEFIREIGHKPTGTPIKDWIDWPQAREFVRNHICK